jgi:sigma-B regulation protein RsbU (phosphoserine phosphatase)
MAKKDPRTPEQKIKQLEMELADRERELLAFRRELGEVNVQLEKFINQMAGELKLASLIQRSLVPTEIPTIPGFEFSTKFVASPLSGGDYFDIFELEDKMRFGIIMANSSGHGMASLFLSVLLKLTTQMEARKGMEPSEVAKNMTKEMQGAVKSKDMTNLFYAVIDRRHYTLTYSKAGNINAYLYKREEDKLVRLDATQGPIAKNSKANPKNETISLDPRDKLILTSEGVTKALNRHDEAFGEERLFEHTLKNPGINCHDLRNEILFQLSKFVDGREYIQDLSILVMEVKDKVIKLRKG